MTADKTEELLRKIRLLKAKAEDPSVTEAEASVFAAKVAQLLAAHGLEEAQLRVEEQSGIVHEDETIKNNTPARRILFIELCRLYMVKPILPGSGSRNRTWVLVGRKHNLIIVREMAEYLVKTVSRLGGEYVRTNPGANNVDFRRGCFVRLVERRSAPRAAAR